MGARPTLKKEEIRSNYTGSDDFDVIIVGAGVSGLFSGLFYLKHDPTARVLIVEKNPYPGGYVTAYTRGDYVFETSQLFPDIIDILHFLDIDVPLRRFSGTYMRSLVVHGDEVDEYRIPAGPDTFVAYLSDLFPEKKLNIQAFMNESLKIMEQLTHLKATPSILDMIKTPFVAPTVTKNLNRTFDVMMDRFGLDDPKLREALETFNAFSGIPSDKASAIIAVGGMLASMTASFRLYGFFDSFPAKLSVSFQEREGEMLLKGEVERIVVEGGVAVGVMLSGENRIIRAKHVITTADTMYSMLTLVGAEHLPDRYHRRLVKTVMSPSAFNVALGLDDRIDLSALDLDYPFNVISTGVGTTERLFEGFLQNENLYSDDCFHAAVICPSLTTGGKNTITINVVPFAPGMWQQWREGDKKKYREEKQRWADFFIDIAERYFVPNLKDHIVETDISTPATYRRYSGSPSSSIFDMATTVNQFGPKRLPMKTPIKNLYLPKFAHGIYGGAVNGMQVVDIITDGAVNRGKSLFALRTD
ncbi:MAG: NAD(P)/FAD-dependent oxidoreductase [Deltaproteobacteria bacterium]|nr:NAD(P)/FAD-dependent oxidoreductase [Candidatus Zymogenaceae bacterium]